jgi:hypothetical protein
MLAVDHVFQLLVSMLVVDHVFQLLVSMLAVEHVFQLLLSTQHKVIRAKQVALESR